MQLLLRVRSAIQNSHKVQEHFIQFTAEAAISAMRLIMTKHND